MKIKERRRRVVKLIRIIWGSLDTHLDYAVSAGRARNSVGDERFHAKTAQEYIEALNLLGELLD